MSGLLELMTHSVWAMEARKLELMAQIVWGHVHGIRRDAEYVKSVTRSQTALEYEARGGPGYATRGRIAVIPIGGVVAKYASHVNGSSQPRGTSIQLIRQALRGAVNDPNIDAGMLLFDTPGGSLAGLGEMQREIMQIDQDVMPIESFIQDLCASAGMYLASGSRTITATRENVAKSLGVYTLMYDTSKWYTDQGVTVHLIASGKFKGSGADGPPILKHHLEKTQLEVEEHNEAFAQAWWRGRRGKQSIEQVHALFDGSVSVNQQTLDEGVCDALGSEDDVVERMNSEYGGRDGSQISMTGAGNGAGNTQIETLASPAVAVPLVALPDTQQSATPAGDTVMADEENANTDTSTATAPAAPAASGSQDGGTIAMTAAQLQTAITKAIAEVEVEKQKTAKANIEQFQMIAKQFGHVAKVPALLAAAIAAPVATTIEVFQQEVMDAVAKATAPTGSIVQLGADGAEDKRLAIETVLLEKHIGGLAAKAGKDDERGGRISKVLGFDSPELYRKAMAEATGAGIRQMRLRDIAAMCVESAGMPSTFGSQHELLYAAASASTGDFPKILANVAKKSLQAGFNEIEPIWSKIARPTSMSDFKDQPFLTMSQAANLLEIPEGKRPDIANFFERQEKMAIKTYGRKFGFTRQMFINDDLGAFVQIPNMFGNSARRLPDILLLALIATNPFMDDGVRFFDAAHGNVGGGVSLSSTALRGIYDAMRDHKDFGEESGDIFLDITPEVLLVPSNLHFKATELNRAEFDPDATGGEQRNVPNLVRGMFDPVSSPRLKALSDQAYYMFADPGTMPALQVGFLDGNQVPIITPVGDGSILDQEQEVVFDCGVGALNFEAAYKEPGA